jgi:glycogen synthase
MSHAARHIMMTTDTVGGVWVYATTLARALARRGEQVTLVTLGPAPRADQRAEVAGHRAIELIATDLALEWMDPAGHDLKRASESLVALACAITPDIIHLNSFREGAFAWPAPVLVVAHSCVTSWWQACRGGRPDEVRWHAYARAVDYGLRAADAWVAPTAAFGRAIADIYAPPAPCRIIHNGIEDMPVAWGRRRDVVLASGRIWDPAKNLEGLLAAAPDVSWPIEVAGAATGPNGETVVGAPNAALLGEMPRLVLLERMRHAAIYAAPARYEPFGLGVLEAARAGCALVLSDIPTLRELWDGAALFVDPCDRRALADTLNRLCIDGHFRDELARAASRRARQYGIDATAARYSALYDAIGRPATPSTIGREARA